MILAMGNDGLAESNACGFELSQLLRRQLRMPLGHESDCVGHPLGLLFGTRFDDAALTNGGEKLVASAIQRRLVTRLLTSCMILPCQTGTSFSAEGSAATGAEAPAGSQPK
jgi:hypothetical protein